MRASTYIYQKSNIHLYVYIFINRHGPSTSKAMTSSSKTKSLESEENEDNEGSEYNEDSEGSEESEVQSTFQTEANTSTSTEAYNQTIEPPLQKVIISHTLTNSSSE